MNALPKFTAAVRALRTLPGLMLGGLLLACTPGASTGDAAPGNAQQAAAGPSLTGFHRALSDLESGRRNRLNVVQIGDSHTANDHFSGRLRRLLQERFGDAGRGMMPPGYPFPYWRPYQVQVEQSGWQVVTSNRQGATGAFGLSGHVVRGAKSGDRMTLTASDENAADGGSFDSVELHFFRRPGGGALQVSIDGRFHSEIETGGGAYLLDRKTFDVPAGSRSLELRPRGNGPVDLADWAVYRKKRGVTLTSHGFSGATIEILGRWDWRATTAQLRHLDPGLVILAFGTNEGFAAREKIGDYAGYFASYVDMVRQAVPNASVAVVGPPDANRLPSYCGRGADGACAPLRGGEIASYSAMLNGRDRNLCRWHAPAALGYVRDAQRQVARQKGVFFWDWSQVQGGECGADKFARQGLGHGDHVHMRQDGYWASAERLFEELVRGYRRR